MISVRNLVWVSLVLFALCGVWKANAVELSPKSFDADVVHDNKVWLVEFYSPMCGSCQEFAPTWEKIEKSLKPSVSLGKINIDHKEGMNLAESLGVLDEGLPLLRVFSKAGDQKGTTVPVAESLKRQYKDIVSTMKRHTTGLEVGEHGLFLKATPK